MNKQISKQLNTRNMSVSDCHDIDIYQDEIDLYLQEFMQIHDIEPKKITSMQWAAAMRYIYNHTFKQDNSCLLARLAPIDCANDYNIIAVNALCDRYIDMCYTYQQRICIQHFCFLSGIEDSTIYSWGNDSRVIYIYNNPDDLTGNSRLTIRRKDIHQKLVKNTMIAADDLMLTKSGVNSIAYRNAVNERYNARLHEGLPAIDSGVLADSLGITADIALLPDSRQ